MSDYSRSNGSRDGRSSNRSSRDYSTNTSISTTEQSEVETVTASTVTISNPETPSAAGTAETAADSSVEPGPNTQLNGESSNEESSNEESWALTQFQSRDGPWSGLTPRPSHQDLATRAESQRQEGGANGDGGDENTNESSSHGGSATNS